MLRLFLSRIVRYGTLTIFYADGRKAVVGQGEPHVAIRFSDSLAPWQLLLDPDLKLGELYMAGRLTVEAGDDGDLLALLMRNLAQVRPSGLHKAFRTIRRLTRRAVQYNPASQSKKHVKHHYDLSGRLYDLFPDDDRQYSCAYFQSPRDTLDAAQRNKKRHIAAKLNLDRNNLKSPGHRLRLGRFGAGNGGRTQCRRAGCDALGGTNRGCEKSRARKRARQVLPV